MSDIELLGVSTNNLKKINVVFPLKKITAVYGRSGAGKTSLAFASLYKLCQDEFNALEDGFSEDNNYLIEDYRNIIPAVAINQKNTNNNPSSTIYSYLNFPQILCAVKKNKNTHIPEYQYLKINKVANICPECHGAGEVLDLDIDKLMDKTIPIENKPFYCWKNGYLSDYYHQLLLRFCEFEGIDTKRSLAQLSKKQQHSLLYSKSTQKIAFRYKHKGRYRQKQAFYQGVYLFASENKGLSSIADSIHRTPCQVCSGSRIHSKLHQLKILSIPFIQFLIMPIDELYQKTVKIPQAQNLTKILKSICDVGLGYLSLCRSIPSLSGGELQKLKLSRLLHTDISGVLFVIDEISAQINEADHGLFLKKIKAIAKQNTVVLVEHSQKFIDFADKKIHIGHYAGKDGGYICKDEAIQPLFFNHPSHLISQFIIFKKLSKFNVIMQDVAIPKKCLTVFTGVSGSGKSSLAKAISEQVDSIYITQKLSNYSSRSILASSLGLSNLIADYFSKNTKQDRDFFLANKEGGCKTCGGIGIIKYERGFDKDLYLQCPQCEGKLFDESHDAMQCTVHGFNIAQLYDLDIKTLSNIIKEPKINRILESIVALGLSHLQLNRKTQTLSGGELRRIKLCEHLSKQKESQKILIIDEPIAGLDPETASRVLSYIYQQTPLFAAVIMIEHRKEALLYADYEVVIGPQSGKLGGKVLEQKINSHQINS